MDESKIHLSPSPLVTANFFSRWFFFWLGPLFAKGFRTQLKQSDLHEPLKEHTSSVLTDELEVSWLREVRRARFLRRPPKLWRAMAVTYFWKFVPYWTLDFVQEFTKLTQPVFLGYLLTYFSSTTETSTSDAYLYACLVCLCSWFQTGIHPPYFFGVMKNGMMMRVSCSGLIYKKALTLSNAAMMQTTTGQIVNLLSNDVQRLDFLAFFMHFLVLGPLMSVVVLAILWTELGPISLAGFAFMMLLVPLQYLLAKYFAKLRGITAKLTDERVKKINEIILGMRVIKMYIWEKPFGELIARIRRKEVQSIFKRGCGIAVNAICFFVAFKMCLLLLLIPLVLLQPEIAENAADLIGSWSVESISNLIKNATRSSNGASTSPYASSSPLPTNISAVLSTAKTSLLKEHAEYTLSIPPAPVLFKIFALLQFLRLIMFHFVPYCIQISQESKITFERIETFLLLPELKRGKAEGEEDSPDLPAKKMEGEDSPTIVVKDLFAAWEQPVASGLSKIENKMAKENRNGVSSSSSNGVEKGGVKKKNGTFISVFAKREKKNYDGKNDRMKSSLPLSEFSTATVATPFLRSTAQTLNNVSLSLKRGELVMVIGPVAAGKSSLLASLLGEIPVTSVAEFSVSGKVAYVAQQPWVFSASVRQNILFGRPYNSVKFKQVLKACDLAHDLSSFVDHEWTQVGERGVTLSGGQKARVSLARAAYSDSDVLLLDDPLSAVDARVSKHLFENCICGENVLKEKTRILVTHQLQFLPFADRIVILNEGVIVNEGSYDELVAKGVDFKQYVSREEEGEKEELDEGVTEEDEKDLCEETAESAAANGDLKIASSRESLLRQHHPKRRRRNTSVCSAMSFSSTRSTEFYNGGVGEKSGVVGRSGEAEETIEKGTVDWGVYWKFFRIGGGSLGLPILVFVNLLAHGLYVYSDFWLSDWTRDEDRLAKGNRERKRVIDELFGNFSSDDDASSTASNWTTTTLPTTGLNFFYDSRARLFIYIAILAATILAALARGLVSIFVTVNASSKLHDRMYDSVSNAPILFFDTNPSGRILNRFSKDIGWMDDQVPLTILDFSMVAMGCFSYILVAGIVNPWVFIPTVPLAIVMILVRAYYLASSRDIKRIEATAKSRVFAHLGATMNGLITLRAYRSQPQFLTEFHAAQDVHTSGWFAFIATTRWLAIRLDVICAVFITCVCLLSVWLAETLDGGLVGLSISYSLSLLGGFQWAVRQSAEVENQMTSVERVLEYTDLDQEPPKEREDKKPPHDWPDKGSIEFSNVSFGYTADSLVLKNLNFVVEEREKIGVVGRTGAGKSSLIQCLFRMAEPTPGSRIRVDGVDILQLGLHDLRKNISIIPQDPYLFCGTLRKNLDPFGQYSDADLWQALEEVHLKDKLTKMDGDDEDAESRGLEFEFAEGGTNFSVGQRQLICLARAVLRRGKILVMDEATANVDHETDQLIQDTIRTQFKDCTVITVAHRLHTIIDSDRILVMRDGFAEELDEPHRLLMNPDSLLTSMVKNTDANAPLLFKMAKEAFEKKRKANGVEGEKERINGVGEERTKERKEVDNEEKKREEKKSKSRRPSGADSDPANVGVVSQEVSLSLPEVAVSPPDEDDDRDVVA